MKTETADCGMRNADCGLTEPQKSTESTKKILVIYHSADFDGIFCREIARRFYGNKADYVGWDFGNDPLAIPGPEVEQIVVMDLPCDRPFGLDFAKSGEVPSNLDWTRITWIDHHATSIASHPSFIFGYRIDGVAACRLAWQWFFQSVGRASKLCRWECVKNKEDFINRTVKEPWAVRLAGEYDVWDKRDPDAEVFQFGLRSEELITAHWEALLEVVGKHCAKATVERLLEQGKLLQRYQQQADASVVKYRAFDLEFEGVKFLALNTARCNSLAFTAGLRPEHDGCLGFFWNGSKWKVSLYGVPGKPDVDLSRIAVKHGGGGHKQACGFECTEWPWKERWKPCMEGIFTES